LVHPRTSRQLSSAVDHFSFEIETADAEAVTNLNLTAPSSNPPVPPQTNMRRFLDAMRKRFPRERLYEDTPRILPYASDGLLLFSERPIAVVNPIDRDEVIDSVKICHEYGIPFVARGSGTSLSGGSLPIKEGIVIGLNRLNHILKVDPANRVATVEPGVINSAVTEAVRPHGLYFAPDPSSQTVCTIGGNLAFNSGGAHCLKYGMTSNHILGITAVLPDGKVVELGNQSLENAGPDGVGLYVGSEGLLGIALEIQLRLTPLPETFSTVLASYDSLEKAGDAVAAVIASGILPGAMEIMDKLTIEAVEAAAKAGYPLDAEALLLVELDGEAGAVASEFQVLKSVIEKSGADQIRIAGDDEERALIWKGRKSAFSAMGRLSPDYIVQDGVVPRSKLGYALKEISRMSAETGIRVANVFHAGDGNLHPLILFDNRETGAFDKAEALAGEILRLCLKLGGSITGEHGVGVEKKAYMPEMFTERDLDAFRRIRDSVDPKGISNRGKMLPGKEAPALNHTGPHPLEKAGIITRM